MSLQSIGPGIYKISGKYSSVNGGVVEVLEATEEYVKCKKENGDIVTLSRKSADVLRWNRLDQAAAYGNDCSNGRCET